MSFIAAHLGITPGARVIEAGTGSGSFSHYLTRTVARNHPPSRGIGWQGKENQIQRNSRGRGRDREDADKEQNGLTLDDSEEELSKKEPSNKEEAETMRLLSREPDSHVDSKAGRVWSFEFHAGRAVKAWDEFQDHGLFPTLSLRHRNVCKTGFGLHGVADAVFLDLPAPWEAVEHAAQALRLDVAGRICCFSPCIEQVLKTVEALRKGGTSSEDAQETRWVDIETYECLNRTHLSIWAGRNGQAGNASIQEAISRIKTVEEKKARRREAQIARVKKERLEKLAQSAAKEGGDGEGIEGSDIEMINEGGQLEEETAVSGEKRKRDDQEDGSTAKANASLPNTSTVSCRDGKTLHRANVYARPFSEVRPAFSSSV
jgi:tRNA (adenine57-N1/adenine58-N1)-methyltransferase